MGKEIKCSHFINVYRIQNEISGRNSHCAALSFTAEEGTVILPKWMLNNLNVKGDEELLVHRVCLPNATFCKLKIQGSKIINVEEYKIALKKALTKLYCLTTGDVIRLRGNHGEIFHINVVKTEPEDAVKITACHIDALGSDFHAASFIQQPTFGCNILGKYYNFRTYM